MMTAATVAKKTLLGTSSCNTVLLRGTVIHTHQEMATTEFARKAVAMTVKFGHHTTQQHQKLSQLHKENKKSLQMVQFQLASMFMRIS